MDAALQALLQRAEGLVGAASGLAFALDALPGIALPPTSSPVDRAQLQGLATLYLAAELEGAGALTAAEDLVRLARSGSLRRDVGAAEPLLQDFWQSRHERISQSERLAVFARLFGTPGAPDDAQTTRNADFEERMIDLCEALYRVEEAGTAQPGRLRVAARALRDTLLRAGASFTALVAQELLEALRQALQLLGHHALQQALGVRGVWELVAAVDRMQRRNPRRPDLHLRRGQAGMTLLAWLADQAQALEGAGALRLAPDAPVIEAAVDWLEASLALSETGSQAAPTRDDWSAFAA
jgi:hypothetical protein